MRGPRSAALYIVETFLRKVCMVGVKIETDSSFVHLVNKLLTLLIFHRHSAPVSCHLDPSRVVADECRILREGQWRDSDKQREREGFAKHGSNHNGITRR